MSEETKFQQQILFEEQTNNLSPEKQLPEHQIVIENEEWQPVIDEQDEAVSSIDDDRPKSWLWRIFTTAILAVVSVELVNFFIVGMAESPIITSLYGIVILSIGILTGSALFKELAGLSQLKRRNSLREQINQALDGDKAINADVLCQSVTDSLPSDLAAEQVENWQQTIESEYSNEELLALYSRNMLAETDQKALAEVAKYSSESVVLVALSPVALLDMMIMLWRNLKMVDKVAGLYGLRLGYWSRIKLVKQVISNMLYAGASEVIADVSTDMLGADLLGKLSGRLAQGLGAGMLTARLGLKTIYLCRPMPFDENAPKLSQVRQEVVKQIKSLL